MSVAPIPIQEQIWDMKYRLKRPGGVIVDETVEDTWRRVAAGLAAPEGEHAGVWAGRFYRAMDGFKFLPGGRIIAGTGTGRDVTLFNCFVMGVIPDSLDGIFAHLREAALTMQQGGGIGYDFSSLRPKGSPVKGVDAEASGPLTFMDTWDSMCRTIMSAGYRRGAMMATLRCDHPDIEAFVDAKREPARLRMFNLSVLVSDAFLAAVDADREWPLVFDGEVLKTVRAAGLWDRIMRATYDVAEPGVIFIDRINRRNNLAYCETISSTNPCFTGETLFLTDRGYRRLGRAAAEGKPVSVWDGRNFVPDIVPAVTGRDQRLLTVELSNGVSLECTPYHGFEMHDGRVVEARDLEAGDRLAKYDMPVIRTGAPHPEAYTQGFYSGDGTALHLDRQSRSAVLRLYGEKKALLPHLRGVRAVTEPPSADGARIDAFLEPAAVDLDKGMVPSCDWDVPSRLAWLAGLADADGAAVREPGSVGIQITSIDRDFLLRVRLMLTTLGVADAAVAPLKPAGLKLLPDGKGGLREYPTQDSWRLIINASRVARLQQIGFACHRLRLDGNYPARDASRFIQVRAVRDEGKIADQVYCFTNPVSGRGCFAGIVTRQCGEVPLPPYGACLLGSVNLAALVRAPFTADAGILVSDLRELVRPAVRMLDNVIDVSRFTLDAQRAEAQAKRRMGLGVTGLADALMMTGRRYGSPDAVLAAADWLSTIEREAYLASAELAAEKGPFPAFDRDRYLAGEHVRGLDDEVRTAIAEHGMRNSHLLAIAPTGTISLFAGNVSSGIEPAFSLRYTRDVLQPDGSKRTEEVTDFAYRRWRELKGDAPLPDWFADAQTLTADDHLAMLAAAAQHVDQSISKTINLPAEIPFDDFTGVYRRAYALGCKSCTTYRPNEVTGAVLSVAPAAQSPIPAAQSPISATGSPISPVSPVPSTGADGVVHLTPLLQRPKRLPGETVKIAWPDSAAIYATFTDYREAEVDGRPGRLRPFELFLVSNETAEDAWRVLAGRLISAILRRGGDVAFVAAEMQAIVDKRGGAWLDGRYVSSVPAAIGIELEAHMRAIGFLPPAEAPPGEQEAPPASLRRAGEAAGPASRGNAAAVPVPRPPGLRQCPQCSQAGLVRESGCDVCKAGCGYSKCQ